MPRILCHLEGLEFDVAPSWDGACPSCGEGFVEIIGTTSTNATRQRPGSQRVQAFTVPMGRGTIRVMTTGPDGPHEMIGSIGGASGPVGGLQAMLLDALLGGGMIAPDMDHFFRIQQGVPEGNLDAIITNIMNEYEPSSRATSARVRESLPSLKIRADSAAEPREGEARQAPGEPCTVCHDTLGVGDVVMELPCNHCFHPDCIMPWLESHNTCPICRMELPADASSSSAPTAALPHRPPSADEPLPAIPAGSFQNLISSVADRWRRANASPQESELRRRVASEPSMRPPAAGPSEGARLRRRHAAAAEAETAPPEIRHQAAPESAADDAHLLAERRSASMPSVRAPPREHLRDEREMETVGLLVGGALAALAGTVIGLVFSSRRS